MTIELNWEKIDKSVDTLGLPAPSGMGRAKVPGGWLIWAFGAHSDTMTYMPDPNHDWVIEEKEKEPQESSSDVFEVYDE